MLIHSGSHCMALYHTDLPFLKVIAIPRLLLLYIGSHVDAQQRILISVSFKSAGVSPYKG